MKPTFVEWSVKGGNELSGTISLKGSKNGALAVLCASLLTIRPVILKNIPRISDVMDMVRVLQSVGSQAEWESSDVLRLQRPSLLDVTALDRNAAQRTRAVVLLMACFATDHEVFTLPIPGGCQLGQRSLEPHIDALRQLGLRVECYADEMSIQKLRQTQNVVTLLESGDTVTENAILAAVALRRGQVQIRNASCNYMVQSLCHFLQKLGVSIAGVGTPSLIIRFSASVAPGPISFSILEDPIEAFFFIAAAIVTKSNLRIERVPMDFISLELLQLDKMGLHYETSPRDLDANGVTTLHDLSIFARDSALSAMKTKIHPNIFPYGINVDNLPFFGPIAAVSGGVTLLHDWMYEYRASYFALLKDFGVCVEILDAHRVRVIGPASLHPADSRLPPALRPASMILLTALASPGESRLQNVDVLSRGYECLLKRLGSLGAHIDSSGNHRSLKTTDVSSKKY
jgi:UDP-N-acetylglucosamine 1-carboxyvinyltransferase